MNWLRFVVIVLVRGRKDIVAQVLEAIIQKPDTAPTRIFGRVGVSYRFLQTMLDNGLLNLEPEGRKRFKTRVTERGRDFLAHYRECNKLFPLDGQRNGKSAFSDKTLLSFTDVHDLNRWSIDSARSLVARTSFGHPYSVRCFRKKSV